MYFGMSSLLIIDIRRKYIDEALCTDVGVTWDAKIWSDMSQMVSN